MKKGTPINVDYCRPKMKIKCQLKMPDSDVVEEDFLNWHEIGQFNPKKGGLIKIGNRVEWLMPWAFKTLRDCCRQPVLPGDVVRLLETISGFFRYRADSLIRVHQVSESSTEATQAFYFYVEENLRVGNLLETHPIRYSALLALEDLVNKKGEWFAPVPLLSKYPDEFQRPISIWVGNDQLEEDFAAMFGRLAKRQESRRKDTGQGGHSGQGLLDF